MGHRRLTLVVGALFILSVLTFAQTVPLPPPPCATKLQSTMLCVVPQVYGTPGLYVPNPRHTAHFAPSQTGFQVPLSVSVGTELSLASVASPASGVVFTYDQTLHTFVPSSTESYGPVLTERAETIGRHRIFVATTYQYFNFSSLDGIDLHRLPLVYSHAEFPVPFCPADKAQCDPTRPNFPAFQQEYIQSDNRIDLKAHQVTFSGTFGLTQRIDVSLDVPILDVGLGITSNVHVVRVPPQPVPVNDPAYTLTVNGYYHFWDTNNPAGSLDKTFSNSKRASGVGDVVFRVKATVLDLERARVALGLNIRTPTGDAENFLGSGAPGIRPFIAAAYAGRVSPHVNLGFQYNGSSVIAGALGTGSVGKLPNQFLYSGGVDVAATRWLTLDGDLLGSRLSSSPRLRESTFANVDGVAQPGVTQATLFNAPVNIINISTGAKINLVRNLLLTANVAFKANNSGLRAKVTPLAAISYSF